MTIFTFVILAVLMFLCIFFYIRAFSWIMLKGSPTSQLIVSIANIVFCLIMAKCNSEDSKLYMAMFLLAVPCYLIFAFRAFNNICPTKEKKDEQV